MKLADLRKLSVSNNVKIRFRLRDGLEGVITEHGIAQIPALRRAPGFNLEDELAGVSEFLLETAGGDPKRRPQPRHVSRDELASMAAPSTAAAEHDDD